MTEYAQEVEGGWIVALWICSCGARNRIRDERCRSCGDYKPDWKEPAE